MHKKTLYIALVAYLVISAIDARKTRRGKRPKEEDDSTPQPNVVTYSTFGFNDVNSYDGFVPSSPDYASYLNTHKEPSTRLYAPAFPTALDKEYGNGGEGSHTHDAQAFQLGEDSNGPQASMLQYPQNSMSFFNTPMLESESKIEQGVAEEVYGRSSASEPKAAVYGAKLSSKNRNKFFNGSDYDGYSISDSNSNSNKYFEVPSSYQSDNTQYGGESSKHYQNPYSNYSPPNTDEPKQEQPQAVSYKYPKVVDFTKFKQYYPTEIDTSYMPTNSKLTNSANYEVNNQNENKYSNTFENFNSRYTTTPPAFKNPFSDKNKDDESDREVSTLPAYSDTSYSNNHYGFSNTKDEPKLSKSALEYKDKYKYKTWPSTNITNDYKNPIKGYQYSTNVSNMNFEFDFGSSKPIGQRRPASVNITDEYVPASSNHIDYSAAYQYPETENSPYSSFKKIPSIGQSDDYSNIVTQLKYQDNYKYDPAEYVKSLYNSPSPSTSSTWGNIFKNSEYSYNKYHPKRPLYDEDAKDDVVHIGTKRPFTSKYNFGKYSENKPVDWQSFSSRPHKSRKPVKDLDGELSATRYKTEEDLLGLRTHDTSHPSYLPTYGSSLPSEDYDYKKLVDKWRQSYLRSKYKDSVKESSSYDFESYPSETKSVHVPIPKPYPIEIPHPVIVPVPQPYPVQVPMPKPIAVPVIQEITIPIEKPVPYAVYKKVPYPVEKLVPYQVEKEVKVPVSKPYPVHVPQIRPVFHHTKPVEDDMDAAIDIDEEYDYMPRPSNRVPYAKRIRGSRNRTPRRPSSSRARPSYVKRRWPARSSDSRKKPAPVPDREHARYPRRPSQIRDYHSRSRYPSSSKHHELNIENFDSEGEYLAYIHCKRTGNC